MQRPAQEEVIQEIHDAPYAEPLPPGGMVWLPSDGRNKQMYGMIVNGRFIVGLLWLGYRKTKKPDDN